MAILWAFIKEFLVIVTMLFDHNFNDFFNVELSCSSIEEMKISYVKYKIVPPDHPNHLYLIFPALPVSTPTFWGGEVNLAASWCGHSSIVAGVNIRRCEMLFCFK